MAREPSAFNVGTATSPGLTAVATGVLPARRRPDAEFLAWSAVHGLAMLVIDGPLRALDPEHVDRIGDRLLDVLDGGL